MPFFSYDEEAVIINWNFLTQQLNMFSYVTHISREEDARLQECSVTFFRRHLTADFSNIYSSTYLKGCYTWLASSQINRSSWWFEYTQGRSQEISIGGASFTLISYKTDEQLSIHKEFKACKDAYLWSHVFNGANTKNSAPNCPYLTRQFLFPN